MSPVLRASWFSPPPVPMVRYRERLASPAAFSPVELAGRPGLRRTRPGTDPTLRCHAGLTPAPHEQNDCVGADRCRIVGGGGSARRKYPMRAKFSVFGPAEISAAAVKAKKAVRFPRVCGEATVR